MTISAASARALQRVTDAGGVLVLLQIDHASISPPLRLVNDTSNVVSNGNTYVGLPFAVTLPTDQAREVPRAQLQMDNVGRDITAELEGLPVGAQLTATLSVVHRSSPDVVDYQFTAPLSGVRVDVTTVTASMGPTDLMRRAAVALRFDPLTAPGLFPD